MTEVVWVLVAALVMATIVRSHRRRRRSNPDWQMRRNLEHWRRLRKIL